MNPGLIYIVYVYDKIISVTNSKDIEEEIKVLVIQQDKQCHSFELRDEDEVGDFLGIPI